MGLSMTPRKAKGRRGGGASGSGGRWVSVTLYAALGVAGAFLVSFLAGVPGSGDPSAAGLTARTPGELSEIRVEVLNGAGTSGLAGQATDRLRASGFDVVFFGNASSFDHARSMVLDRVGDPGLARSVAAALGIDSVATVRDSTLLLDVSVVLGGDWPPQAPEPTGLGEQLLDLVRQD